MRFALVGIMVLVLAETSAMASAATCTVTQAFLLVKDQGVNEGDQSLPTMIGYPIPIDIDASSGAFRVDFTAVPDGVFDISGVNNSVAVSQAGMVTGRLDSDGNMALGSIPVTFTTDLLPGQPLNTTELLTSGLAAVSKSGTDYVTEGSRLDFTTGSLTFAGQGLIFNAPVVGTSTSGLVLSCTLAPIPAAGTLPKGPTIAAHAVVKPGGDAGDSLTLKGKLKNKPAPFDATKQDVFVRIRVGSTDVLFVRAPAGALTTKGKKSAVSNAEDSAVHVLTGGKAGASVLSSLTIVESKKAFGVTLKQSGLDLSALTAASGSSAQLLVEIGSVPAESDVTVKASAKKTTLK
jgi:hypothetical protein